MRNKLLVILPILFVIGCSKPSETSKSSSSTSSVTSKESLEEWGVYGLRINGNTLTAKIYANYSTNAQRSSKSVMEKVYFLATDDYPNVSQINIEYGLDYTDKYGNDKKVLVGNFSPNLTELRKYKYSSDYTAGELSELSEIYRGYQSNRFR